MSTNYTEQWQKLFETECSSWDPRDQQRFLNIPNDQTEVDAEELEACKELVAEIKSKRKAG